MRVWLETMAPVQKLHGVHVEDVYHLMILAWTSAVGNLHALPQRQNLEICVCGMMCWRLPTFWTGVTPSFAPSTFRNQAYRNFVLWQHGPMGAGRRVPVQACVCRAVRERFPQPNGQYRGYHSPNSEDSE